MASKNKVSVKNLVILAFWLILILLCIENRDKITVDAVVNFTPENTLAAIVIMLLLFAVKGITIVVYGGILYAASGIMFPLPVAIIVNIIGTALMITVPFVIGRKSGGRIVDQIINKYPKLEILRDISNYNGYFISFFVRIVGLLPADPLGMYLGASGISYKKYLLGSIVGLLPAIISFSVMGMSADDVSSPAFIISAICEIGLMVLSVTLYFVWRRKRKRSNEILEDLNVCKENEHIGNAR